MLEDLMNAKNKQMAPPEIVAQVFEIEREGLEDDRKQDLWSDESSLIAVLPIQLDPDGVTDYLAYPVRYLPTFCGAHSISCWVFKGRPGEKFDLVLAGRHDAARLLPRRTSGCRDIDLVYWSGEEEVYSYRYDGVCYREKGKSAQ
ncbi:MAG: hypothetical protein V1809_16605 [Planctomycetota bacterium]